MDHFEGEAGRDGGGLGASGWAGSISTVFPRIKGRVHTHTLDKGQGPIERFARLDVKNESESCEELATGQGIGLVQVGMEELENLHTMR